MPEGRGVPSPWCSETQSSIPLRGLLAGAALDGMETAAAGWAAIRDVAPMVSYGWGVIPVSARVGDTGFTTSLFPKNGGYLVPLKDAVRSSEGIDVDDTVSVQLTIDPRP